VMIEQQLEQVQGNSNQICQPQYEFS
jgi:hypothetical protein